MSRPCTCERYRVVNGAVMMPPQPGECELCIAFAVDATRRAEWGGDGELMRMVFAVPSPSPLPQRSAKSKSPAPCSLRGRTVPGPERQRLGLGHAREWVYCLHPDKPLGEAVCGCKGCGPSCTGYTRDEPTNTIALPLLRSDADSRNRSGPAPVRQVPDGVHHHVQPEAESHAARANRIDALPPDRRTAVAIPGHFNAGLIEHEGALILASRDRLHGARVHLAVLTSDQHFARHKSSPLSFAHADCAGGQADPRLFHFRGRLHVAFYGEDTRGGRETQHQFYAALNDDLTAGPAYRPRFKGEVAFEKNWGFFEHDGELYAVRWIAPHHEILRIDGDIATIAHETYNAGAWSGGELRGGAPPVRVGDEYIVWAHGRLGEGVNAIYSVGVYAFEARPPFRVTRQTVAPLLWATDADRQPNGGCRVVFPQGAILREGKWLVSMGAGDQRIDICEWDAAAVEKLLVPVPSLEEQIASPPAPRPPSWRTDRLVIAAHQRAADDFLRDLEPYPEGRYSGRGVVIAAGGPYWASAYVTIRMLRHTGCTLPVEVWYLGERERDERYERLLAPHGVTFHDIDSHPARAARRTVAGFGAKLFAVVNSAFAEVLCLDPDSYPCADPTVLFDHPEYHWYGGIYWPDRDFTDGWTKWKTWGCRKRGTCGLETGQYVLDKRIAWEPMRLAEWYDDHPDLYYGKPPADPGADYGDKGPHRAAWAKLRRDFAMFATTAKHAAGIAYVHPGPDGKPMFVHRCQSKFSVDGSLQFPTTPQKGENVRAGLPGEEAAFGFLAELSDSLLLRGVDPAPRARLALRGESVFV